MVGGHIVPLTVAHDPAATGTLLQPIQWEWSLKRSWGFQGWKCVTIPNFHYVCAPDAIPGDN
jgi:hypothetical protein